jgi:hypothetical protein
LTQLSAVFLGKQLDSSANSLEVVRRLDWKACCQKHTRKSKKKKKKKKSLKWEGMNRKEGGEKQQGQYYKNTRH